MLKYSVLIIILLTSIDIFAAEISPKGKIIGYYTGWAADIVRIKIQGASYTENNCPTKDSYITTEADNTGYKTHISALLSAYMSGKPVSIVVEGCALGRPRILGVSID